MGKTEQVLETAWFALCAAVYAPRVAIAGLVTIAGMGVGMVGPEPRGIAVALPWTWIEPHYVCAWTRRELGPTRMQRFVTLWFRRKWGMEVSVDSFTGPREARAPSVVSMLHGTPRMAEGDTFPCVR